MQLFAKTRKNKMKKTVVTCTLVAALAGALALGSMSCGSDGGGTPSIDAPAAAVDAPTISGTYSHYVTSEVHIVPAASFSFDLDGTGKKNRLGGLLGTFNAQIGLEDTIAAQLQSGEFVLLHSIKAASLTASAASWQVYLGTPFTDSQQDAGVFPKLDGTGTFTIKSGSPTNAIALGSITGGTFTGGPGNITIQIAITSGDPVTINLVGARIEAQVTADGCTMAKIGGGIPYTDLVSGVLPTIAADLDARLDANGCRADLTNASCDTTQSIILSAIDAPTGDGGSAGDRHITVSDLTYPLGLIGAALLPDVDLLPGVENPVPGAPVADQHKESISIGLGFGCVKGTFTASGEN
jgi:hypothetical protein